jgi:hypothetical protein
MAAKTDDAMRALTGRPNPLIPRTCEPQCCRLGRATSALPALALLGLLSACAAGPGQPALARQTVHREAITSGAVVSLLHQYDFPEVRDLRRVGNRWQATAYRDGVWLPVEVLNNGTLLVIQYG